MSIPLYQVIIDDMITKIESGFYPSNSKLPSEKEISEMYDVSRITSKRALNELENLNYITRIQGKGSFVTKVNLRDLSGKNILLLMPYATSFGNYNSGILKKLDKYGMNLQIRDSVDLSFEFIKEIKKQFEGVIYYPRTNEEALEFSANLLYYDMPCVFLDKEFAGLPYSSVTSDNLDGTYQAVRHLIEEGSKNLVFISSTKIEYLSSVMERFLGFVKAKREHELPYSFHQDVLVVSEDVDLSPLLTSLKEKAIDGIVCENDIMAIKVLNAMNQNQIRIPIVGFDNIQAAGMVVPSLTTLQQNFEKIGSHAAALLIEKILDPHTPIQNNKIKTELIIRESSKEI